MSSFRKTLSVVTVKNCEMIRNPFTREMIIQKRNSKSNDRRLLWQRKIYKMETGKNSEKPYICHSLKEMNYIIPVCSTQNYIHPSSDPAICDRVYWQLPKEKNFVSFFLTIFIVSKFVGFLCFPVGQFFFRYTDVLLCIKWMQLSRSISWILKQFSSNCELTFFSSLL